ncbi:hypothetical protein CX676_11845 [Paracoccus zhejiangensis]|uniref:Hedgehog/Intein (Hint) domain-containing protein n=2 Tax=Paracoccus zhejiangensis TaxID=1077935 RepID=A0A2H5EZQ6_9RHOB|nr:hypothetical protein CX676_11845 [Paracoccus zhejiangensis]
MTRTAGNTEIWTVDSSQTVEVLVFFGTQAEFNALLDPSIYDLKIIDNNPTDDKVGAQELRTALNQAISDGTLTSAFAPSNNQGYLGTSQTDYDDHGLEDTAGYSTSGQGIESSTSAVLISLHEPVPLVPSDPSFEILAIPGYKGGVGNFSPYFPGTLGPNPICFVSGTMIETVAGPRAVETLAAGDLINSADRGAIPLRLSLYSEVTPAQLARQPELRPIRISVGALGADLPDRDLLVSPQHRILIRSKIAQRMFGTDEVLVAAKQLLQLEGIDIASDLDEFRYYHLVFDQHEVIRSNGALSESLYPGPEALRSVGRAARREIYTLFPHLRDIDPSDVIAARMLASGRQARKLANRHLQNRKPLLS